MCATYGTAWHICKAIGSGVISIGVRLEVLESVDWYLPVEFVCVSESNAFAWVTASCPFVTILWLWLQ